jgi:hypothetical protein
LFDAQTFQVTVDSVNDAPVATDDDFVVQEDSEDNLLYPLADDSDADGDNLIITRARSPGSGTVRLTQDGTAIAYSPDPDFYGLDSFAYTISDGNGGSATATITVHVENVNDDPVAEGDEAGVLEDSTSNVISVLDNDTYLPDPIETLSIAHVTSATYGVVVIAADGSYLSYTPGLNYAGPDAFTYTVTDGHGGVTAAAVNVTVRNVNDDPVTGEDYAIVDEDTVDNRIDVLDNDTFLPDPPETLTIVAVAGASHGTVDINDQEAVLEYTPGADYYGTDQLRYTISDGNGGLATGTVAVTVENVNDDPLASGDAAEMDEDSAAYPIEVLVNDTYLPDPLESLTIVGVSRAQHGAVTIVDGGSRLTYRPNGDFFGQDAFAYTIGDGHGGYDTASVDVTVLGINDPPYADGDSATTQEDTPVTVDVLDNDTDIDGHLVPSTVRVISGPGHGSSSVNSSTGEVTYTPGANWSGNDTLIYRVCDDGTPLPGLCNTASVSIAVGSVNDPPLSDAGPDQDVDTDAHVTLDGSGSTDPDGDLPLLYEWQQTGGPHVILGSTRAQKPTFVAPGDPGVLTFTLRVIDSQGQASLRADQVVVTVHNQPPIANAGPDQTHVVQSTITLDGSGSNDPDLDTLVYFWAQIGGLPVTLSSATAVKPTFTAPAEPTVLIFALSVTDSFGDSDPSPDQVVVQVRKPFYVYLPMVAN